MKHKTTIQRLFFLALILLPAFSARSEIKITETTIKDPPTIRSIYIHNHFPFFEKEIRRLVLLQPGAPFTSDGLNGSETRITTFLEKRGFENSLVTITAKPHAHFNVVDLSVKITKGKTYNYGKITIDGNVHLSDKSIAGILRHFGRFQAYHLAKNLKQLRQTYAELGFVRATIKVISIIKDDNSRQVDLTLAIKENKHLKVLFIGQPSIAKHKLLNILNFAELRAYDQFALEDGQRALQNFYAKNGYSEAIISGQINKPSANHVVFTYTIHSGPLIELEELRFNGNKSFGGKKLKKYLLSRESKFLEPHIFDAVLTENDQKYLDAFYKNEGFFDVTISGPQLTKRRSQNMEATFTIDEGQPYRIGTVALITDKPVYQSKLLQKADLKTGKNYEAGKVEKARVSILKTLQERGYAYASVTAETHKQMASLKADVSFYITRGSKVHVRHIIIKGNNVTRDRIIRHNISLKEGGLYNDDRLLDSQLNLRKLGTFSTVRMEALGANEKQPLVDIVITVHERKTITVTAQAGYDSQRMASGEFSLIKRNLFGSAKTFSFRGIGGQKFDRAEATFFSPRIFGASWNLANQYFVQYEDEPNYNATRLGLSLSTLKNFGPLWSIAVREQVTRFNVFESESNAADLGISLFDNTLNEFQTALTLDLRDNYSDPKKGAYFLIKNELNTDLQNPTTNFDTLEVNISHHQAFLKRFTLNTAIRYGQTFRISNASRIPVNKLFFLGGSDSLRGFSEDSIDPSGGTFVLILNSELHFRLFEGIKLASFLDAGTLLDSPSQLDWNAIRESAGIGLRYFTPIGPLRLDVGFPLDRQPGEPKARFHFSFGFFF
jgi:outer membrane protein insertion porin family